MNVSDFGITINPNLCYHLSQLDCNGETALALQLSLKYSALNSNNQRHKKYN